MARRPCLRASIGCFLFSALIASFTFFVYHFFYLRLFHQPPQPIVQELFFTQPLDHYTRAPIHKVTFEQRYFIDRTFWAGGQAQAPIFVFLAGATDVRQAVGQIGVLNQWAPHFRAMLLYIEHRFYGKSVPLGSIENAIADPAIRGYLTVDQALPDFAELIVYLQENYLATKCPVILIGRSYGGILAIWLSLKYPHIFKGVLASSAPVFYFYGVTPRNNTGLCTTASNDFEDVSPRCHDIIHESWSAIDSVAAQPNGLDILTNKFKTCRPLVSTYELKSYLAREYIVAAKYNSHFEQYIKRICDSMTGYLGVGGDIIDRVSTALFALNAVGDGSCRNLTNNMAYTGEQFGVKASDKLAWNWQLCSDMLISSECENNTMGLPVEAFDLLSYLSTCEQQYGESPTPNWITIQYGENHLESTLAKSGANVIFSNGLKDPYSTFGVLSDISDNIVAVNTKLGSHSLDLEPAQVDDPKWLVQQRDKERSIIEDWISDCSALTPSFVNIYLYLLTLILLV